MSDIKEIEIIISCIDGTIIYSKNRSISDQTQFIDLMEEIQQEIVGKNIITIDKNKKTIYVKGLKTGNGGLINAIVDSNYNVFDVCYKQNLFKNISNIAFVFDSYPVIDFKFKKDKCSWILKYFAGSRSYGKYFCIFLIDLQNIHITLYACNKRLYQCIVIDCFFMLLSNYNLYYCYYLV